MNGDEVRRAINSLSVEERRRLQEFVREASECRRLTPEELGELAQRMVDAKDPAEGDRLQEELIRGFYGRKPNAET